MLMVIGHTDKEADWVLPVVQHARSSNKLLDMAKLWALTIVLDENKDPSPWRILYSCMYLLLIGLFIFPHFPFSFCLQRSI
jgi:hypothetical protein